MKKRIALAALILALAVPAVAQKGPDLELGFQPGKLYDYSEIDSVNLFNGNLMLTVPIGPRKQVSKTLSYQMQVIYNGKVWDHEAVEGCVPAPWGVPYCTESLPNRRSNAGLGWRLTFGRLLPPSDPTIIPRTTSTREAFVYESAAGDEHGFYGTEDVMVSMDASALRLVKVPASPKASYDVEFPSGERHRFEWERNAYRLKKISDRFGSWVTFTYEYDEANDDRRVLKQTILDSTATEHVIHYAVDEDLNEGVDRGSIVDYIDYMGFGGAKTLYDFSYTTMSVRLMLGEDRVSLPMLTSVAQPDGSSFQFNYYSDPDPTGANPARLGAMASMVLPTGGSTVYEYQEYVHPGKLTCADWTSDPGIKSRTISDGNPLTKRRWDYVHDGGHAAPVTFPDPLANYCCSLVSPIGASSALPHYWFRTSVLSPEEGVGSAKFRTRSDHYFDTYSFDFYFDTSFGECPPRVPFPGDEPRPVDPWAVEGRMAFGYPGTIVTSSPAVRKGPLGPRVLGDAEYAADADGRRLTTEVYSGCTTAGDCTNGKLERSTHTKYENHPLSVDRSAYPLVYGTDRAQQLQSSKTVFHEQDDAGCDGDCYIATDHFDDNGAGVYGKVVQSSNFPDAESKTTITKYDKWEHDDLFIKSKVWITGLFTERNVSKGTETRRQLACFNATTGFLERTRLLVDSTKPSKNDLLTVYEPSTLGDIEFVKNFGGDKQNTLPETHDCSTGITSLGQPWYQVETHYLTPVEGSSTEFYTGGFPVWSKYYKREDGTELAFKSLDLWVDVFTGVVVKKKDTAGVTTTYDYEAKPVRLKSVKPAGGATASYEYENSTASRNAHVIETVTGPSGVIATNTYEYDGLGRVKRSSKTLPNGKVAVVQNDYDALGRAASVTQPIELAQHPFSDVSGDATDVTYDAFNRQKTVRAPDLTTTTFEYSGIRRKTRAQGVATSLGGSENVVVTEFYDAQGRLESVIQRSGPGGSPVTTDYTYNIDDRLIEVSTTAEVASASEDVTQTRTFTYDERGFLEKESHPETQDPDQAGIEYTTYEDYDARGHAWKRTIGGVTTDYTFDSAERLVEVAGPSGPLKKFVFEVDGADDGKLRKAIRYNRLSSPGNGNIEVTESYIYGATGKVDTRKTLVERAAYDGQNNRTATTIQEFDYGVTYDENLLPDTIRMPRCTYSVCAVDDGLFSVTNNRTAGRLTEVEGFATLTYHPSGMVEKVQHQALDDPTDTYSARNGIPRPSKITFTGCTNTDPYFDAGFVRAKVNPTACGIEVSWPAAMLCGAASTIKYRVLRDGVNISGSSCITGTKFLDTTAVKGNTYTYTVVAEGPEVEGGMGVCQRGLTEELVGKPFKFESCDGDTQLVAANVWASIGRKARFSAKLSSANGPLVDEDLTFSVLGTPIGTAKTGPTGEAVLEYTLDLAQATHKDGVTVSYAGGLFPAETDTADITIICDFMSYTVVPSFMNVGAAGGIFAVAVNTSNRCSWEPMNPSGFLSNRVGPIVKKQGYGEFNVDVPALGGSGQRSDNVWVDFDYNTKNIPVEQGSDCTFRFSTSPVFIPYKFAFDGSVNVIAPAECEWTVTDDQDWLDLISWSGKGNGIVSFRADVNNGKQRMATLSINGGVETARVNQEAPPPVVCPTMVSDLEDGGTVRNGQNVSLRIHVEGTYLNYRWYANGRKIRDCPNDDCSALTLAPGDAGYPDDGETVTYVATVDNEWCEGVVSKSVTFRNAGSSCSVPLITNSFPWGLNQAPGDHLIFGHSSEIKLWANASGTWQWYRGKAGDESDPISAADGGNTDTATVRPHGMTFYWAKVTNSCGSQISRTAAAFFYQQPRQRRRSVSKSFNGDVVADLVWHNTVTGANEIWTLDAKGNRLQTFGLPVNTKPGMRLQSVGDIDDSERPDLVWRDPETGANEVWRMSGTTPIQPPQPIELRKDGPWTIGGVADLDDDYNDDIVWHNEATGENEIWFMDGADREGTWALPANSGQGWGLHGADDFSGDGRPDLFFHNRNTGENSIWVMNDAKQGPQITPQGDKMGRSPLRRLEAAIKPLATTLDPNWMPAVIGNFDGDSLGRPDIVWRNVVTGEHKVWVMSGLYIDPDPEKAVTIDKREDLNWQIGGGGSTVAGPSGTGTDPRTATSIAVVADPPTVGTAVAVTATLAAGSTPLAQRELVFALNGSEFARLRTDATGLVQAAKSVAGIAAGTYPNAITVRFDGDTTHNASSSTTNLVVTAAPATVTWTDPAPIGYGTPLSAAQLNATADVPGTFVYTPPAGTILNAGYQTLGVTFTPADATLAPITKNALLIVQKALSSVTWASPEAIKYGAPLGSAQLNATSNLAGEFTYDPEPGTLLAVGNAQTLRVTFEPESPNHSLSTATTTIDVGKGEQIIRWSDPATMPFGDALTAAQLNAAVITSGPAPAGALTYTPPAGTLLPEGTHELKVSAAGTDHYNSATATVDVVVARSSALVTWNNPAPIVYGTPLSSTQLNATTNVPGTFAYTPPAGTILSAGTERLAVVFTPADSRYQPATAFVTIEITKATPVATWSAPAPIVYGSPLSATQLNATTSIPGQFAYTPKLGSVLDAGRHELTAKLIPGDVRNYESVTLKVFLDVAKAEQIITWPQPAPIVYGTPLSSTQLAATVTVVGPSPAGAVTYSPAAGTVLQAGAGQALSVSVAATPNYNAAGKTVTLDVLKATPVLTWPQPAPIVYKALLGATQLNATANVPGTLIYTPPAGTLLEAGLHTLTASFTPTDTGNYNDASTTTTLEVQKADPVLAWSKPAEIVYGTALSSTQLNATADVPGTFDYTPAAGTILDAGTGHTLSAHFTPSDTRNYNEGDIATTIDVAKAPQTIVWTAPVPIVYGTALSATQLNAAVQVVGPAAHGALTYTPPAGTVLDAGGQVLSVAVAETPNYLPASASVTLDVLRAPLSLVVDAKSKLYGAPVPALTGVLTGVVNNDPIAPSYATTATHESVTGTYPITATLVDPNNRLVNYDVTITPSTLTVLPAPLTIAANPASKQYSDPLPQLTATFTGFVLGETPAVLTGVLSIQTTAERLSPPGTYPITIGGLTSSNYAITYVGSTFTVTAEDARVLITSPAFIGGARSGLTSVTLAATVRDISVTAEANGDVDAGDIRTATLTFVDRSTDTVLCTAPIGLLVATDERTGVATCTFTRDFGTTLPALLTVGARVGGHYTRDAAAEDLAMTIATPTEDSLNGGGSAGVASAAGPYAPQTATSLRFNVNLQYDKDAVLKGKLTFAFTRTEGEVARSYELTAAPVSMSIRRTAAGGLATIVGTATLRDVTDSTAPAVIVDGAPLVVTATDAGEPSVNDAVSVVLLKRDGGIWLATGWDGLRAVEQRVGQGNVQVVGKK